MMLAVYSCIKLLKSKLGDLEVTDLHLVEIFYSFTF